MWGWGSVAQGGMGWEVGGGHGYHPLRKQRSLCMRWAGQPAWRIGVRGLAARQHRGLLACLLVLLLLRLCSRPSPPNLRPPGR